MISLNFFEPSSHPYFSGKEHLESVIKNGEM